MTGLTETGIDTIVDLFKEVVYDVSSSKSEGRCTRVEVGEIVPNVSHGNLGVLALVTIRMANEGSLEMIVKFRVGHGGASAAMGNVKESVVAAAQRVRHIDKEERREETYKSFPLSRLLDRSRWSSQILLAFWTPTASPAEARTLEILRLRTMTLLTPLMLNPTPSRAVYISSGQDLGR